MSVVSQVLYWILLLSELIVKILPEKLSNQDIDYLVRGGKHDRGKRGKEALVPPPARYGFGRPYLVHRLAIYNRLCQSGLVADYTGHSSLAVLSGPSSGWLTEHTLILYSDSSSSYQEEKQ